MHDFTWMGALVIFAFCGFMMYKPDVFPLTDKDRSVLWIIFLVLVGVWCVLSENIFRTGDAAAVRTDINTGHCHALYKRASSSDSLHIAKNNVYCLSILTDKKLRWDR